MFEAIKLEKYEQTLSDFKHFLFVSIKMVQSFFMRPVIVSSDESQGCLGFSTVMLPPQRFPFGRDNLKNILVRPFKFGMWVYGQCHKRYCFVTLTFNFKISGSHLMVIFWPFFHILPQFLYTES